LIFSHQISLRSARNTEIDTEVEQRKERCARGETGRKLSFLFEGRIRKCERLHPILYILSRNMMGVYRFTCLSGCLVKTVKEIQCIIELTIQGRKIQEGEGKRAKRGRERRR